ncbi:MAG: RagB/SusD family nutrient uptake outer membrane protein [Mangrovibacterium sp.]
MKTKIIIINVLLFVGLVFNSCEKDLDLYPKDRLSESTFLLNAEQYKLFASQFYFNLPTVGTGIDRDYLSDIITSMNLNTVSNGSYFPTPSSGLWSSSYSIIRNTTYLVEKSLVANDDLKSSIQQYVGEARFFRAMAYFNLYRDFGGVPIIDKVLDVNDDDLIYGPRRTREEVVNYILSDLNDAISLLASEANISGNDKGRISKEAALSFKARVALFEGTWRKYRGENGNDLLDMAIEASFPVINGVQFELFNRADVLGNENYRYLFILDKVQSNPANITKANCSEFILRNRYDNNFRGAPSISAHGMPSATRKFVDLFLCTDGLPIEKSPLFQGRLTVGSEFENRDPRMNSIIQKPLTHFWASYPPEYSRNWSNSSAGGVEWDVSFGRATTTGYFPVKFLTEISGPLGYDYPVIRLAEVLLIYAEAKFERNGSISDDDLNISINKLRARAGLPGLTNAFVSSNGLDMKVEIRRERTVELFLEGFRYDDLRRWKTAEVEMPQPLRGVQFTGTQYAIDSRWSETEFAALDFDGTVIVETAGQRKFEEKHYLFPIPTRQILLNPQLTQNSGWE